MNAPIGAFAGTNVEAVQHIAQDLRAEAHRTPDDVARIMRQAAVVCDAYVALRSAVGDMIDSIPQPVPFPPPQEHASCS